MKRFIFISTALLFAFSLLSNAAHAIEGCTDPAACNYDPAATEDDGSCCYQNCITLTVTSGSYPAEISFSLTDVDNNIILGHNLGESLPRTSMLCIANGCYKFNMADSYGDGWNGATYTFTDENGTIILSGMYPNDPAFNSFSKTVYFTIGGGSVGCTDPMACNYDEMATCNDGSCDYTTCYGCTDSAACNYDPIVTYDNGSCCMANCALLEMIDTQGDGWDNGTYFIYTSTGELVTSGTLSDGDYGMANICLEDGCYGIEVTGSFFPEEIFWTLYGSNEGDIYGDGMDGNIIYFSIGTSGTCAGCTDPIACNYQIWAQEDDGSCLYVPCVENDFRSAAIPLQVLPLSNCTSIEGDLSLATNSVEAQSATITGEDIWYSFVATRPGIRIETSTSENNLVIELQDNDGNLLDAEDIMVSKTGEILNFGNLQVGSTYYIAVRNFNSTQGEGLFEICLQSINGSNCNYPITQYVPCSRFKASYSGSSQYSFNFTSLSTGNTYNHTSTSGVMYMHNASGILPNDDYEVSIESVWQLTNGSGNTETVNVKPSSVCTIRLNENPPLYMRPNVNCTNAGSIPLSTFLRAIPIACGVVDYQWQFTDNDGVSPVIEVMRGAPIRTLQLTTVPGLQGGHSYQVRVRPYYTGNVPGTYGPSDCISIASTAIGDTDLNLFYEDPSEEQPILVGIYPNPNQGSSLYLEITDVQEEQIMVNIVDATGKLIHTSQYMAEDELSTVIYFEQTLPAGLYLLQVNAQDKTVTKRFVVNK